MSIANISIVGNLVRMPEKQYLKSGHVKTTLKVAVNKPKSTNGTENQLGGTADYYRVETWGKLAELSAQYLNRGNQVTATGRLVLDHWLDREGKERVTPVIQANQVAFPQKARESSDELEISGSTFSGELDLTESTASGSSDPFNNESDNDHESEPLVGDDDNVRTFDMPKQRSLARA